MRPLLFEIPIPFTDISIPIFSYGLALMLGFLTGAKLAEWMLRKKGQKTALVGDFMFVALVCGIFGSRALAVWEKWDELHNKPLEWFEVWNGGLTYYGGLIFATAGCMWFLRRKKQDILWFADMVTPALALGLAWGRLGCLLNGCCYGAATAADSIFGVVFPAHCQVYSHLPEGAAPFPVYPTQVYSVLFALGLMGLTIWVDKVWKTRNKGQLLTLAGVIYALFRFGIEMIRADNSPEFIFGTTISQTISLGFGALCLLAFVWLHVRGTPAADGPHTPCPGKGAEEKEAEPAPVAVESAPEPAEAEEQGASGKQKRKRRRRKK